MNLEKGYIYVANKRKFINEALVSSKSLRRFTTCPIAIIVTNDLVDEDLKNSFDIVKVSDEIQKHTYLSKIIGMQETPFQRTVFLDSDTFVTTNIDELFDILDIVDIATTQEYKKHTYYLENIKYRNILPEFNSGVIVYKKSPVMNQLIEDWFSICTDLNLEIDMPGLREAILKNIERIRFSILPEEYNSHGYKTMIMLNGYVKVIHERLGTNWKTITPFMDSFENMDRFSKKINKNDYKRIYVPYVGIIPYNYSPWNVIHRIKKMLGIKRVSKNK